MASDFITRKDGRMIEERLGAARVGSIGAVRDLQTFMAGDVAKFNRIAPILVQILSTYHPTSMIFGPDDARTIFFVQVLDAILTSWEEIGRRFDTVKSAVQSRFYPRFIASWDSLSRIYVSLTDNVVDAYMNDKTELKETDPFRYRVFKILVWFVHFNYRAAEHVKRLELITGSKEYMCATLRIWAAESHMLSTHTYQNHPTLTLYRFERATKSIGVLFFTGPEPSLQSYLTDIPFLRPDLFLEPLTIIYRRGCRDIDTLSCIFRLLAGFTVSHNHQLSYILSLPLKEKLMAIITKCLRCTLIKHLPEHRLTREPLQALGVNLLLRTSSLILHDLLAYSHQCLRPALIAQALHCGLIPLLRRMLYLGQCSCSTDGCLWARGEYQDYPLLDNSEYWEKHCQALSRHFRMGGTEVYGQYHASMKRWVEGDIKACEQPGCLKPAKSKTWDSLQDSIDKSLKMRAALMKLPLQICQGPQCESSAQLYLKYKRCSACLLKIYCSKACQRDDWRSGHDEECGGESPIDLRFLDGYSGFDQQLSAILELAETEAENEAPLI